MQKALAALKDVGPKGTGSEVLDHACDEFHCSWDDAIKKIADSTQLIEEKLKVTKQNYEVTEQAIRDALHKGAARQSTPSSAAPQARPVTGVR